MLLLLRHRVMFAVVPRLPLGARATPLLCNSVNSPLLASGRGGGGRVIMSCMAVVCVGGVLTMHGRSAWGGGG